MAEGFLERAIAEVRRGVVQVAVLALLRRQAYGYDLIRTLASRGLLVEEGTLYPVLRRLQKAGLLNAEWDTTGARPRKYYETTDKGKAVLRDLVAEWHRVDLTLNRIVEQSDASHDDGKPQPDTGPVPGTGS